jgi:hypothetical protein
MPVSWTLDHATGIVRIDYAHPYTFEDWRAVSDELRRHPQVGFRRDIGFLTNRANLGAPPQWFSEAATAYAARFPAMLRGRKIAFLARTALAYDVALWQARIYDFAGAISTAFLSYDAAELWLQERSPDWTFGRAALCESSSLC